MTTAQVETPVKSAAKAGTSSAIAMLTGLIAAVMGQGDPSVYPDWGMALFWFVFVLFVLITIALIVRGINFAYKTITVGRTTGKHGGRLLTIGYSLKMAGFILLSGAALFWTYHMITDNTVVSGKVAGLEMLFMLAMIAFAIALVLLSIVAFGQAKRSRQLQTTS